MVWVSQSHCLRVPFELGTDVLQAHLGLARALAAVWALGEEQVQQHCILNKPALRSSQADVSIGRAVLPVVAQADYTGMLAPANANQVSVTPGRSCHFTQALSNSPTHCHHHHISLLPDTDVRVVTRHPPVAIDHAFCC